MGYIVYKITNTVNNKIYIGLTNKSLQKRWKTHCNSAFSKNDPCVFHKAIRKYGEDSFKKEILESDLTEDEAKEKEIFYIKKFNSYYLNGYGYNMTFGGEINSHLKGEKSKTAILSDFEAAQIRTLLKNNDLSYGEILIKIGRPNTENFRCSIARINKGTTFFSEEEVYPIRIDSRKMPYNLRKGEKNPRAKLNETLVLNIIKELENSNISQAALAKKYSVTYNTINLINRCKIWNDLHSYKHNIRKESNNIVLNLPRRVNTDEKILSVIYLLEQTQLTYKEIADKTNISVSSVIQINSCKIGKNLHNYCFNIRKERK